MRHRKCDTDKHCRRVKKLREKHALRLQIATSEEQEAMLKQAYQPAPAPEPEKPPPRPICPLCNQDITLEDGRNKNLKVLEFNRKAVPVHRTCPKDINPLYKE